MMAPKCPQLDFYNSRKKVASLRMTRLKFESSFEPVLDNKYDIDSPGRCITQAIAGAGLETLPFETKKEMELLSHS